MHSDDRRSQLRRELIRALEDAKRDYQADIARIIAESEPLDDTAYAGAARAWKRARDQAWRQHRLGIAELRREEASSRA